MIRYIDTVCYYRPLGTSYVMHMNGSSPLRGLTYFSRLAAASCSNVLHNAIRQLHDSTQSLCLSLAVNRCPPNAVAVTSMFTLLPHASSQPTAFRRFAALTGLLKSTLDLSCIGEASTSFAACNPLHIKIFTKDLLNCNLSMV